MNTELFPTESMTVESPRLKWIKERQVITAFHPNDVRDKQWTAEIEFGERCFAATEDDALVQLALKRGWKLWNEK